MNEGSIKSFENSPAAARQDRRVSRTRRQLRDALMELILEKGYDAVKVEDITDRADLGRTTFYLHFRDKEELLIESIEAVTEELKAQVGVTLNRQIGQGTSVVSETPLALVFEHASQNSTLYRIILNGGAAQKVLERIRELAAEAALEYFSRSPLVAGKAPALPMELLAAYFASSLLGFLTFWLEKGMPYPVQQTSEIFLKLFMEGAQGAFGEQSSEL